MRLSPFVVRQAAVAQTTDDGSDVKSYAYYANGALKTQTLPGGITANYTYFDNNRLKTLQNKQSGTILEAYQYAYDGAGNITAKQDVKGTTAYSYTVLNQLLTVTEHFFYDGNGNMLGRQPEALTAAQSGSGLPFLTLFGDPNAPDLTPALYSYNDKNQMVEAANGSTTVNNSFNAEGYRASKTAGPLTTYYAYEYDRVIMELDSQSVAAYNVYGVSLISRDVGGDKVYYLYNGHGDVTGLVKANGTVVASYYYDAFGVILEETGSYQNPFRYSGYYFDSGVELYNLHARFYDAKLARFMQEDSYLGDRSDPLSLNLYTYCNNNPLIYWDPTGHYVSDDDKANLTASQVQDLEILTQIWDYYTARGMTEQANEVHDKAEEIRNSAGYSGGTDGSAFIPINNNNSSYDDDNYSDYTPPSTAVKNPTPVTTPAPVQETQTSNPVITNGPTSSRSEGSFGSPGGSGKSTSNIMQITMLNAEYQGIDPLVYDIMIVVRDFVGGWGVGADEAFTFGIPGIVPDITHDNEIAYLIGKIAGNMTVRFMGQLLELMGGTITVIGAGTLQIEISLAGAGVITIGIALEAGGSAYAIKNTVLLGAAISDAVNGGGGGSIGNSGGGGSSGSSGGSGNYNHRDQYLSQAQNGRLKEIVNQLYRPGASVGDGGTADMLRHEFSTGQPLDHLKKAQTNINAINNLLSQEVLIQSDRSLAYNLLNDLYDAVRFVSR